MASWCPPSLHLPPSISIHRPPPSDLCRSSAFAPTKGGASRFSTLGPPPGPCRLPRRIEHASNAGLNTGPMIQPTPSGIDSSSVAISASLYLSSCERGPSSGRAWTRRCHVQRSTGPGPRSFSRLRSGQGRSLALALALALALDHPSHSQDPGPPRKPHPYFVRTCDWSGRMARNVSGLAKKITYQAGWAWWRFNYSGPLTQSHSPMEYGRSPFVR
jgi:hypothetical protein